MATKRRGHGEGSLTKRPDGRYMVQVSMPDGTRQTRYFASLKEAQAGRKDLLAEVERRRGLLPGATFRTVGEFLDAWATGHAMSVRDLTVEGYETYITRYCGVWREIPLGKFSPQHVQKLYTALLGRGLSSTTVRNLHAVLHVAFAAAVAQGVWLKNPCDLVPKPKRAKPKMEVWDETETRRFLAAIVGERFEPLFVVALSTGMRRGELLGLAWDQVDLDGGTLTVAQQLQWVKDRSQPGTPPRAVLEAPKTAAGRRQIILTSLARTHLAVHRAKQRQDAEVLGDAWDGRWNLVFPDQHGQPMRAGNLLRRHFAPAMVRAEVRHLRFHDLRHTAATLLLNAGINVKVISEMLGHANVAITLQLYAHVLPGMHAHAVAVLDAVLRGSAESRVPSVQYGADLLADGDSAR